MLSGFLPLSPSNAPADPKEKEVRSRLGVEMRPHDTYCPPQYFVFSELPVNHRRFSRLEIWVPGARLSAP